VTPPFRSSGPAMTDLPRALTLEEVAAIAIEHDYGSDPDTECQTCRLITTLKVLEHALSTPESPNPTGSGETSE